jgi:hypothetical protein
MNSVDVFATVKNPPETPHELTSHVTSCIVMLKDVIKVSLLQKGQNVMTNSSPDHNTSAPKTVGLVHMYALFTSGTV